MKGYYVPGDLLTTDNYKTSKGESVGWKTFILYMSPAELNRRKVNLCPFSTEGCRSACLYTAGRGAFSNTQKGRINKSEFFLEDKQFFMYMLRKEIYDLSRKFYKLAIRLNGTTDIAWEKLKIDGKNLFEWFPDVQFYDYTKNHKRFEKELSSNYSLTYSRSGENDNICKDLLNKGVNVSYVFEGNELPKEYEGVKVINGDETDLRFLDPKGVIVGLTYKKPRIKDVNQEAIDDSNFVIKLKDDNIT